MLRWGFEFWTRCKPCLYFLSWISDLPSRTCLPDSSYFFPLNKWSCWPASLTASLACAFISWHSFHFPHFICAFLSSHLLAYFLSCLVPVPLVLNEGQKIHGGWGRLICLTGWHCCFWWVLVRSSWSPKWQQIKSLPLRPVCWDCGTREQAGQPQRKVLSHSLEAGWLRSRCLGIDSPWGPAGHIPGLSLVSGAFWQCLALLSLWIHQSPWSLPSSSPCVCVHVPIFPFFIRTWVLLDSGPPYFSVISTYLLLLPNKVTFWGAEVRTSTYESGGVLQFNTQTSSGAFQLFGEMLSLLSFLSTFEMMTLQEFVGCSDRVVHTAYCSCCCALGYNFWWLLSLFCLKLLDTSVQC